MSPRKKKFDALDGITPEIFRPTTEQKKRIEIRATEEERDEIQATAQALGVTVTQYFLGLHRYARPRLVKERDGE